MQFIYATISRTVCINFQSINTVNWTLCSSLTLTCTILLVQGLLFCTGFLLLLEVSSTTQTSGSSPSDSLSLWKKWLLCLKILGNFCQMLCNVKRITESMVESNRVKGDCILSIYFPALSYLVFCFCFQLCEK